MGTNYFLDTQYAEFYYVCTHLQLFMAILMFERLDAAGTRYPTGLGRKFGLSKKDPRTTISVQRKMARTLMFEIIR